MPRSIARSLTFAAAALFTLPASAQITQKAGEGSARSQSAGAPIVTDIDRESYSVEFDDDLLDGVGLDGTLPIIRVRPNPVRSPLLRPRISFVRELKKSVEAI